MYSQNVFIQGSFWIYQVQNPTVDTKTNSDLPPKINACPQCVFEVTELSRTGADILKPPLDWTLVALQITEI